MIIIVIFTEITFFLRISTSSLALELSEEKMRKIGKKSKALRIFSDFSFLRKNSSKNSKRTSKRSSRVSASSNAENIRFCAKKSSKKAWKIKVFLQKPEFSRIFGDLKEFSLGERLLSKKMKKS